MGPFSGFLPFSGEIQKMDPFSVKCQKFSGLGFTDAHREIKKYFAEDTKDVGHQHLNEIINIALHKSLDNPEW
jgi:hypothetical protein